MFERADGNVKSFRVVGAIFCVFGFIFALIGILSFVFPTIQNDHMKMILNSFQESSPDPLTNTLNTIVRFCLHSGYFLLFCGISLMVVGGLISYTAYRKQSSSSDADEEAGYPYPIKAEVPGDPRPAYYPGGMEPDPSPIRFDNASNFSFSADEPTSDFTLSSVMPPSGPIVGGIEPSFSLSESDSERLMQFDRQIKAQAQAEPVYIPNDPPYGTDEPPEDFQQLGDLDSGPLQPLEDFEDDLPQKPRIVSTMGKRKS